MAKKERADERAWFETEIEASKFQDARLRKRLGMVLEQLWSGSARRSPFACQDWSSTKAAYRFLSNERVSEQEILSGHSMQVQSASGRRGAPCVSFRIRRHSHISVSVQN
ncbi:IS4/Tn5 family transposase DNA-binding protein [Paraburkholderia fungorum]|uniref:IS4/Tn5 family transposase DNA-binding protein n=1 Tax=Paraburkholderia fungorum TaxID=134537 RepID=UPI001C0D9CEA